nr:hypothetical protein [Tanacetum cinerariifolium]
MLHISPRVPGKSFDELPFKEEILDFLRFLGHSAQIKTLTDVNVNKLFQPWRSFAAVINKDDILFSTIKVVSRHQNTQQYGVILPIELMNEEIRNTKAYKEYYVCATGEATSKPKVSARRKRSGSNTSITPLTTITTLTTIVATALRLIAAAKGKQPAKAKSLTNPSEIARTEAEQLKIVLRKTNRSQETREEEEESFNPILRTSYNSEDDGNGEEDQGLRVSEEQRLIEEEEADELYRDVDINRGRGLQVSQDIEDSHVTLTPVKHDGQQESSSMSSFMTSILNPISDAGVESIFAIASSLVAPLSTPTPTMTPSIITTITTSTQAPIPPTPIPSKVLQNLPTFDSVFRFNERLKSLEASFSEYRQTNPFAEAVSNISGIIHQYINQQMNETIDDNMKRIIKEHVKSQVKDQVSRILPRIEQSMNAQLESEVLTRSSYSSRTSYAVAADLLEMELKKIAIEKMEGNKSIQRSDEQMNLYKAFVEAYKADKIILDSYGERVILKRRRDEDDDQGEGPSVGSYRGSKRHREGKESESARAPLEPVTRSACRSITGSKSRQVSASESAFAEEPV